MNNDIGFSRQVVEQLPGRTLTFLRAVGTVIGIRNALTAAGYTQAEQDYAWQLVLNVSGYRTKIAHSSAGTEAGQAIVEIDNLNEVLLKRGRAVLDRFHPDQAAFVFEGLQSATGTEAVVSVATFLTRLDDLESSPARVATRDQDHAALASLAARGIHKQERDRLTALIVSARQMATEPAALDITEEQLAKDLMALRNWYQDWSETARAVISRRDHLVRLGVAKRRKGKKAPVAVAASPPRPSPVPGPVPVVAPNSGAPVSVA